MIPADTTKQDDLIFDVGMHRGEDTEHYLALGFRVVAVEANPTLVAEAEARFAHAIEAGRLVIVGAAIAEQAGTVALSVADDLTVWTSLDEDFLARNRRLGTRYRTVEVEAIRFADLLREYGVPHYLKVDIEGSDMLCIRALREVSERPDYLSVESSVTGPRSSPRTVLGEVAELRRLGYRRFKFINQNRERPGFPPDSSGPFGEATPGRWDPPTVALARGAALSMQYHLVDVEGRWGHSPPGRRLRRALERRRRPPGWYDLHAKLP